MKNSLLIHLLWAIVAIGGFVVGTQFFGKGGKADREAQAQTTRDMSRSSIRASLGSQDNDTLSRSKLGKTREPSSLSQREIETLGENLRGAQDPISRSIAFSKILEALTPENALLLREQLAHLSEKSPEFKKFHYAWGRIAGEEALAHCADSPEQEMASVLAGWANANPEAALEYFNSLSPDGLPEYYQLPTGLASGLADDHPELAIAFVKTRLEEGDRYTVKLLNTVVDSLIQHKDPETLASLTKDIPKGDLLNSIGFKVVQHLADTDPSQAYAWASALPNGKAKFQGIGTSFARWAGEDPVAAAEHLSKIPKDQLNSAIYGFSSRAAYDDPVTALEWAETITVEKTRNSAVFDAGIAYFRKDPEAAAQWLSTSGLPQVMQEKISTKFKKK